MLNIRSCFLICCLLFFQLSTFNFQLFAQQPVIAQQQQSIVSEISAAAQAIQTLQCTFTQTKELSIMDDKMVSQGTMAFLRPDKLAWRYTSPYDYTFIITGEKVLIGKGKSKNSIDLQSSQAFQGLARLIAGSVTGKSLTQTRDYDVSIMADDKVYIAKLTPKDKRLKKMFANIRLTFNRASHTMQQVEMLEPGGDVTKIVFQNVKQNQPLSDKVFALD